MASGDIAERTAGNITALLLDAVGTGATNDGVWVDCSEMVAGTVVALGAATTTVVTVNAHNGPTKPAAATVGAVVTTGGAGAAVFSSFPALPKFVKCAITATGTGTVTAVLVARRM